LKIKSIIQPVTAVTLLGVLLFANGSKAVGLCHPGEVPAKITASWSALVVTGKQTVRDLWRKKDLGMFATEFVTEVPRHGAAQVRVRPKNNQHSRI
jgi:alpha-galactosidase